MFCHTPADDDYDSARNYLELLFPEEKAAELVEQLKKAEIKLKKAKDIMRASRLDLLPMDNQFVQYDIHKARRKELMGPIMLVRGNERLIIADGFHRMCAAYYLGEEIEIPCLIV
ncbi:MAG: hypothetical protein EAS48_06880 [Chryseobacterium sp.]|nr:MAG: hypothetical protein EAS48_06880 [Chryseobacterium sp.]